MLLFYTRNSNIIQLVLRGTKSTSSWTNLIVTLLCKPYQYQVQLHPLYNNQFVTDYSVNYVNTISSLYRNLAFYGSQIFSIVV